MTLTDIEYVGNSLEDKGYAATICETHRYREVATYAYQLEQFECPACVALEESDRAEREIRAELAARRGHPSICLCHACAPAEAEYDRLQAEELARLFIAEIHSPDYCDHLATPWGTCSMSGCRHAACKNDQEPPF